MIKKKRNRGVWSTFGSMLTMYCRKVFEGSDGRGLYKYPVARIC
jgi:hypothetical protein